MVCGEAICMASDIKYAATTAITYHQIRMMMTKNKSIDRKHLGQVKGKQKNHPPPPPGGRRERVIEHL
jgi:hypothetical protein